MSITNNKSNDASSRLDAWRTKTNANVITQPSTSNDNSSPKNRLKSWRSSTNTPDSGFQSKLDNPNIRTAPEIKAISRKKNELSQQYTNYMNGIGNLWTNTYGMSSEDQNTYVHNWLTQEDNLSAYHSVYGENMSNAENNILKDMYKYGAADLNGGTYDKTVDGGSDQVGAYKFKDTEATQANPATSANTIQAKRVTEAHAASNTQAETNASNRDTMSALAGYNREYSLDSQVQQKELDTVRAKYHLDPNSDTYDEDVQKVLDELNTEIANTPIGISKYVKAGTKKQDKELETNAELRGTVTAYSELLSAREALENEQSSRASEKQNNQFATQFITTDPNTGKKTTDISAVEEYVNGILSSKDSSDTDVAATVSLISYLISNGDLSASEISELSAWSTELSDSVKAENNTDKRYYKYGEDTTFGANKDESSDDSGLTGAAKYYNDKVVFASERKETYENSALRSYAAQQIHSAIFAQKNANELSGISQEDQNWLRAYNVANFEKYAKENVDPSFYSSPEYQAYLDWYPSATKDRYLIGSEDTVSPEYDSNAIMSFMVNVLGYDKQYIKEMSEQVRFSDNAKSTAKSVKNQEDIVNGTGLYENVFGGPTLSSVFEQFGGGLSALTEDARSLFYYDEDAPVDVNSPAYAGMQLATATRNAIQAKYNWGENISVLGNKVDVFDELYGIWSSTLDSAFAMVVGGAIGAGTGAGVTAESLAVKSGLSKASAAKIGSYASQLAAGSLIGSQAAASTIIDSINQGATGDTALWNGMLAGFWETAFETWSISKLLDASAVKGLKGIGKSLGTAFITNASEEFNTEVADVISELATMGGLSSYARNVIAYIDAGYSEDAARAQASKDLAFRIGEAGVTGGLQGMFMGGFTTAKNYISTKKAIKVADSLRSLSGLTDEQIPTLVNYLVSTGTKTQKMAAELTNKLVSNSYAQGDARMDGNALIEYINTEMAKIAEVAKTEDISADAFKDEEISGLTYQQQLGLAILSAANANKQDSIKYAEALYKFLNGEEKTVNSDLIENIGLNSNIQASVALAIQNATGIAINTSSEEAMTTSLKAAAATIVSKDAKVKNLVTALSAQLQGLAESENRTVLSPNPATGEERYVTEDVFVSEWVESHPEVTDNPRAEARKIFEAKYSAESARAKDDIQDQQPQKKVYGASGEEVTVDNLKDALMSIGETSEIVARKKANTIKKIIAGEAVSNKNLNELLVTVNGAIVANAQNTMIASALSKGLGHSVSMDNLTAFRDSIKKRSAGFKAKADQEKANKESKDRAKAEEKAKSEEKKKSGKEWSERATAHGESSAILTRKYESVRDRGYAASYREVDALDDNLKGILIEKTGMSEKEFYALSEEEKLGVLTETFNRLAGFTVVAPMSKTEQKAEDDLLKDIDAIVKRGTYAQATDLYRMNDAEINWLIRKAGILDAVENSKDDIDAQTITLVAFKKMVKSAAKVAGVTLVNKSTIRPNNGERQSKARQVGQRIRSLSKAMQESVDAATDKNRDGSEQEETVEDAAEELGKSDEDAEIQNTIMDEVSSQETKAVEENDAAEAVKAVVKNSEHFNSWVKGLKEDQGITMEKFLTSIFLEASLRSMYSKTGSSDLKNTKIRLVYVDPNDVDPKHPTELDKYAGSNGAYNREKNLIVVNTYYMRTSSAIIGTVLGHEFTHIVQDKTDPYGEDPDSLGAKYREAIISLFEENEVLRSLLPPTLNSYFDSDGKLGDRGVNEYRETEAVSYLIDEIGSEAFGKMSLERRSDAIKAKIESLKKYRKDFSDNAIRQEISGDLMSILITNSVYNNMGFNVLHMMMENDDAANNSKTLRDNLGKYLNDKFILDLINSGEISKITDSRTAAFMSSRALYQNYMGKWVNDTRESIQNIFDLMSKALNAKESDSEKSEKKQETKQEKQKDASEKLGVPEEVSIEDAKETKAANKAMEEVNRDIPEESVEFNEKDVGIDIHGKEHKFTDDEKLENLKAGLRESLYMGDEEDAESYQVQINSLEKKLGKEISEFDSDGYIVGDERRSKSTAYDAASILGYQENLLKALARVYVNQKAGKGVDLYEVNALIDGDYRLNYTKRLIDGDEKAKDDLKRLVSHINSPLLLQYLEWYGYGDYFVSGKYEPGGDKAIRTFKRIVDARIKELEAEKANATPLNVPAGALSLRETKLLFDELNTVPELKELADKVFETAEKLGVVVNVVSKMAIGQYGTHKETRSASAVTIGNVVELKRSVINNNTVSDNAKATIILHEMIHGCTSYMIYSTDPYMRHQMGMSDEFHITKEQEEAVDTLKMIFSQIHGDEAFNRSNGTPMYGTTDVHEMVAELANPEFRDALKKKSLWSYIVDAIKKLFGIETKNVSAFEGVDRALAYMLSNPNEEVYNEYKTSRMMAYYGSQYKARSNDEEVRNFVPEQFRKANEQRAEDDVRHSICSAYDAAGFTFGKQEDGTYVIYDRNGVKIDRDITETDILHSAFGATIDYALKHNRIQPYTDAEGIVHNPDQVAKEQRESIARVLNLIKNTQDPEMVWKMTGAVMFSALKANADKQYGTTIDFSTVCRKTVDMIDLVSQTMKRLHRGLTKAEITELQGDLVRAGIEDTEITGDKHSVPCPVCYVFSRWAGLGCLLDRVASFQDKYDKTWTEKAIQDRIKQLKEIEDKKGLLREELRETDEEYSDQLKAIETLEARVKDLRQRKSDLKASRNKALKQAITSDVWVQMVNDITSLKAEIKAIRDEKNLTGANASEIKARVSEKNAQLKELNTRFDAIRLDEASKIDSQIEGINGTIKLGKDKLSEIESNSAVATERSWLERVRLKAYKDAGAITKNAEEREKIGWENYAKHGMVPIDILFDLNAAQEWKQNYGYFWDFKQTRGAGMGKAILPYSPFFVGDIASQNSERKKDFDSPEKIRAIDGKFTSAQEKVFDTAVEALRKQSLIGGQRYQSTSDFRYDYALDYMMSFLEMQALGGKIQTYTKIIEYGDIIAAVGGDVNLSAMPRGKGYDEKTGRLLFSNVTGIDYNAACELVHEYDNAQIILVGINDQHIMMALDDTNIDGINIGFVIPYHASGASIEDFISALVLNLGEKFVKTNYVDYSDVQNDSELSNRTEENIEQSNLRIHLLSGEISSSEKKAKINEKAIRLQQQGIGVQQDSKGVWRYVGGEHDGETVGLEAKEKKWEISPNDFSYLNKPKVDISERTFDDLRSIEKVALSDRTDAEAEAARQDYLSWSQHVLGDIYNKMWVDSSREDTYGVRLSGDQAEHIMPHEYWDTNTTRSNAYVNGFIFRSYCYSLGLKPRFSGATNSEGVTHGDFTESTGYWKTLIDRPMYANDGQYRSQTAISFTQFNPGMVGHLDEETGKIVGYEAEHWLRTPETDETFKNSIAGNPSEKVVNAAAKSFIGRHSDSAREDRVKSEGERLREFQNEDETALESYATEAMDGVRHSVVVPGTGKAEALKYSNGKYDDVYSWLYSLDPNNDDDVVHVYRAMQWAEGGLRPPMAAKINGEWQSKSTLGVWEQTEEHPENITTKVFDEKKGYWVGKFDLKKGNGKDVKGVDYDPYFHSSKYMLNDQFSEAFKRPNMVVVEGVIPRTELLGDYRAEFAALPVGETAWKAGIVAGKLKGDEARKVYLSRWFMPIRVVPNEEAALSIINVLKGHDINIPWYVVTPQLRRALQEADSNIISYEDDAKMGKFSDHFNEDGTTTEKYYNSLGKSLADHKNIAQWAKEVDEQAWLKSSDDNVRHSVNTYYLSDVQLSEYEPGVTRSIDINIDELNEDGSNFIELILNRIKTMETRGSRIPGIETGMRVGLVQTSKLHPELSGLLVGYATVKGIVTYDERKNPGEFDSAKEFLKHRVGKDSDYHISKARYNKKVGYEFERDSIKKLTEPIPTDKFDSNGKYHTFPLASRDLSQVNTVRNSKANPEVDTNRIASPIGKVSQAQLIADRANFEALRKNLRQKYAEIRGEMMISDAKSNPSGARADVQNANVINKPSEAFTNTMAHSFILNAAEMARPDVLSAAGTDRTTEELSVKEAVAHLDDVGDAVAYDELINKNASEWTHVDIDMAFALLNDEKYRARSTGDYTRAVAILTQLDKAATASGQAVQAFAKYSNKAEGIIVRACRDIDKAALSPKDKIAVLSQITSFVDAVDMINENDSNAKQQILDKVYKAAEWRGNALTDKQKAKLEHMNFQFQKTMALSQAALIVDDYINQSGAKKLNAIHNLALLWNFHTDMVNRSSNLSFRGMEAYLATYNARAWDALIGALTGTGTVVRNTGTLSAAKAAKENAKLRRDKMKIMLALDVAPDTGNNYKYTKKRRTFKGNAASAFERGFSKAEMHLGNELNATDEYTKGKYEGAIREAYADDLKAGKITEQEIQDLINDEELFGTFQNSNLFNVAMGIIKDFGNTIIGFGDSGKTFYGSKLKVHEFGLGDFVIKYTQVAGALMQTSLEFSPLGYLKAFANTISIAKNGGFKNASFGTRVKYAMTLGRATTGTMLVAMFGALARLGVVIIGDDDDDDDDKNADDRNSGISGVSINLSKLWRLISGAEGIDEAWDGNTDGLDGDLILDFQNIEPLNFSMSLGARLAKNLRGGQNVVEATSKAMWESFSEMIEDMSMMTTINNIVNTMKYEPDDTPWYKFVSDGMLTVGYTAVNSFIPTIVRQTARGFDPYYRDVYGSDSSLGDAARNIANNIPGARLAVPVKQDSFGQPKTYNQGVVGRVLNAANAFLFPGNLNIVHKSESQENISDNYYEAGTSGVYAKRNAPYTISLTAYKMDSKGEATSEKTTETYTLTEQQRRAYQTTYGDTYDRLVSLAKSSSYYRTADATEQAAYLKKANQYATYLAEKQFYKGIGYSYSSSSMDYISDAINLGMNPIDFIYISSELDDVEGEKNSSGETVTGSKKKNAIAIINSYSGTTDDQKDLLLKTVSSSYSTNGVSWK